MDEPKIDLSCLDPFPEPGQFDRETDALTADILAARALELSLWRGLYLRARTAALFAAAAACVILTLQGLSPRREAPAGEAPQTGQTWMQWTAQGRAPTSAEILEWIGGSP